MPAYPAALPNTVLTDQLDGTDTVNADDVNLAYAELNQIAATLAVNPQNRTSAWGTGSFVTSSANYPTVKERLDNVENGTYSINQSALVKTGNQTLTVTSDANIGMVVKAKSGQTGNLMEFRASGSDTPVTAVNPSGYIITIDGGTA